MKPRCTGAKTPGHFTSFECVLDEGHDGFCEPYVPPTVDEWRKLKRSAEMHKRVAAMRADDCQGWYEENTTLQSDLALYQAEAKTLRDKLESGDIEAPWRAEVGRLQSEMDALRAIIESGAGVAKDATGLLAKVLRGDYQWPNGVAWAVGEAHRILTGGPPDGVYVRAKDGAGRGADVGGTPRV